MPSSVRIESSATVATSATLSPEIRAIWRRWVGSDQKLDALLTAIARACTSDIADSGLFSSIRLPGEERPDYIVKVQVEESNPSDFHLKVTIRLIDPATGKEIFSRAANTSLGLSGAANGSLTPTRPPNFPADMGSKGRSSLHLLTGSMQTSLQQIMPVLKSGIANYLSKTREQADALKLQGASLPDLLVAGDPSVDVARERNHALIAAKNLQLPGILRTSKSDELSALVVKVEQIILDLDHECEVAKDKAQQAVANSGADSGSLDELRGLAICYRERIELLKPILIALKDEIANRSR